MTARASKFFIPIKPVPAARPKVSKFGTYYPKTYTEWRKAAAKYIDAHFKFEPATEPLVVFQMTISEKARTSKRYLPQGDVDNFAKAALDVLNEIAWGDDDNIQTLTTAKRFAVGGEEVGTFLCWRPMTDAERAALLIPFQR